VTDLDVCSDVDQTQATETSGKHPWVATTKQVDEEDVEDDGADGCRRVNAGVSLDMRMNSNGKP
jgi:hypothetical protein